MRLLFWVCAALVGYTYLGYPLVLYLRTLWRVCPPHFASIFPTISIIICVYNEGPAIREKLHNIAQLHYPELLLSRKSGARCPLQHSRLAHRREPFLS